MPEAKLTSRVADKFAALGLDYFITGSVASAAYGEFRYTHDLDVVVLLRPKDVEPFCSTFDPPEFFVDPYSVRQPIQSDGMFNILHVPTGDKVDVILPADSDFNEVRFDRRRPVVLEDGGEAYFAAPEHVIVSKMLFFQQGGTEKHLRDITGILLVQGDAIDRPYVELWARKLGVLNVWQAILNRMAM